MRVIISGGGSGGHVFPAIAIADALKKMVPNTEILFVGAKGKIEMEKVPKAGYPIKGLWISGFHRKNLKRNLLFPIKLFDSLIKASAIIRKFKPDLVIGVGGFASGPVLLMASRKGIPTLIQEQNSYPGITNKLLAKKVSKICVAYPGMNKYFPDDKIVMTGNPVRTDITNLNINKEDAIGFFELAQDRKTLLLFGGSLGARTLNMAVRKAEELLSNHPEVQLIWQMGGLYAEEYSKCGTAKLPNVKPMAFIDRMDMAYAAADLVICRAGALAIAELATVGKPVLLVPSPNVAEDHQTKNAEVLKDRQAADLVSDVDAIDQLLERALALVNDDDKCEQLGKNIKKFSSANAAEHIAKEALMLIE